MLEILIAVGLFLGMVILAEVGRRTGHGKLRRYPDGLPKGVSAAEGAVFALLGLLIAFNFSRAATRFQARRHLVTEEATRSARPTCASRCCQTTFSPACGSSSGTMLI